MPHTTRLHRLSDIGYISPSVPFPISKTQRHDTPMPTHISRHGPCVPLGPERECPVPSVSVRARQRSMSRHEPAAQGMEVLHGLQSPQGEKTGPFGSGATKPPGRFNTPTAQLFDHPATRTRHPDRSGNRSISIDVDYQDPIDRATEHYCFRCPFRRTSPHTIYPGDFYPIGPTHKYAHSAAVELVQGRSGTWKPFQRGI